MLISMGYIGLYLDTVCQSTSMVYDLKYNLLKLVYLLSFVRIKNKHIIVAFILP